MDLNEIVSRNLKELKTFCTFNRQKKAVRDIPFDAPLYSRGNSPHLTMSMLGDEKPYATFGTGRHFVTRPATAGMTGSVKIGDFKLSSDINKVIVKSSGLQAYNLTKATWQSSIEFSGMVVVK